MSNGFLTGYDCSGDNLNVTSISLVTIPPCDLVRKNITTESLNIVISQVQEIAELHVSRCQVVADHIVVRCGTFSDQIHADGYLSEFLDLTETACRMIIEQRVYKFNRFGSERIISWKEDLRDQTTSFISHGSQNSDGKCESGGEIVINGRSYTKAVIHTKLRIISQIMNTKVDLEEKLVILPNGETVDYTAGSSFSSTYGNMFWTKIIPDCDDKNHIVVYNGKATKITETRANSTMTSFLIHYQDYDFQLAVVQRTVYVCGYQTYLTEHPNLFVTETQSVGQFPIKKTMSKLDVSLMNYINSKMVHTVKHISNQIEVLYESLSHDRCLSEQRILRNRLSIASIDPNEFAYQYFKGPGYTALSLGESISIASCTPVPVEFAYDQASKCYKEIPVMYNNELHFLTPKSRILTKSSNPIPCKELVTTKFFLNGEWFTYASNGFVPIKAPLTIPIKSSSFKFEDMRNLASSGIYSQATLKGIQQAFMLPQRQQAMTSRLTYSMLEGSNQLPRGTSFVSILSSDDKEQISGFAQRSLEKMMMWGSLFSFLLLVFAIFRIITTVLSSFINFKMIAKEFGVCIAVLVFWWDSICHYIMEGRIDNIQRFRRTNIQDPEDDQGEEKEKDKEKEGASAPVEENAQSIPRLKPHESVFNLEVERERMGTLLPRYQK